jgi:hypothetical protein
VISTLVYVVLEYYLVQPILIQWSMSIVHGVVTNSNDDRAIFYGIPRTTVV